MSEYPQVAEKGLPTPTAQKGTCPIHVCPQPGLPADNMRIYRLQTTDGERAIGRLVTQDQLITVYARLGLDCELQMDSDEVFCAVMDKRRTLSLVNGFQLRRSLVMGQPRLELIGVTGSALPEMKALGWFTEVIQWKTRAFIPVGSTEVLAKVLVKYPVASSVAGRLS